jgi:hypothetical protein
MPIGGYDPSSAVFILDEHWCLTALRDRLEDDSESQDFVDLFGPSVEAGNWFVQRARTALITELNEQIEEIEANLCECGFELIDQPPPLTSTFADLLSKIFKHNPILDDLKFVEVGGTVNAGEPDPVCADGCSKEPKAAPAPAPAEDEAAAAGIEFESAFYPVGSTTEVFTVERITRVHKNR